MSASRACGLILAFAGVALTVVFLRAEQARNAAAALRHEVRWSQGRSQVWEIRSAVARLKAPERIRERIDMIDLDLHRMTPSTFGGWSTFALAGAKD